MTGDVVIGASMRANLLSLQQTNSVLDTTQYRLSTGKKVNSALDNAQSFFTAQALNNRATDLGRLLDSMGQSIETIKQADKGITSLTKLIQQAEAVANDAKDAISGGAAKAIATGDSNIEDADNLAALGLEDNDILTLKVGDADAVDITIGTDTASVDSAKAQDLVDAINENDDLKGLVEASLNSSGQLQLRALQDDDNIQITSSDGTIDETKFSKLGLGDYVTTDEAGDVTGTVASGHTLASAAFVGKKATDTMHDATSGNGFVTIAGGTVDVTLTVDGTASDAIEIDENTTIQDFVNSINRDTKINSKISASFDADSGQIKIQGTSGVSTIDVNVASTGGDNDSALGFGVGTTGSKDTPVTIGDGTAQSEKFTLSGSGNLGQLEDDYNEIRKQIDSLVGDTTYRGINLLKGDSLTTTFNEDRSNRLITKGGNFTSAGMGMSFGSFATSGGVDKVLGETKSALDNVRSFGSSIANSLSIIQTREEFTQETVSTLTEGADKLTVADQNEEGAKMLALQTRLQLGVTSLSLASQASQSVLRMF